MDRWAGSLASPGGSKQPIIVWSMGNAAGLFRWFEARLIFKLNRGGIRPICAASEQPTGSWPCRSCRRRVPSSGQLKNISSFLLSVADQQQKNHGHSSANEQGSQATHHGTDFADRGGHQDLHRTQSSGNPQAGRCSPSAVLKVQQSTHLL